MWKLLSHLQMLEKESIIKQKLEKANTMTLHRIELMLNRGEKA